MKPSTKRAARDELDWENKNEAMKNAPLEVENFPRTTSSTTSNSKLFLCIKKLD